MSGLAVLLTCGILTLFSVLAIVVLVVVKPSADSRSAGLSVQTASTRKGVGSGSGSGRKASGGHSSSSSGTALRLVQAGLYRRNAMAVFVAVKFGLALIPMCIGVMAGVARGKEKALSANTAIGVAVHGATAILVLWFLFKALNT